MRALGFHVPCIGIPALGILALSQESLNHLKICCSLAMRAGGMPSQDERYEVRRAIEFHVPCMHGRIGLARDRVTVLHLVCARIWRVLAESLD